MQTQSLSTSTIKSNKYVVAKGSDNGWGEEEGGAGQTRNTRSRQVRQVRHKLDMNWTMQYIVRLKTIIDWAQWLTRLGFRSLVRRSYLRRHAMWRRRSARPWVTNACRTSLCRIGFNIRQSRRWRKHDRPNITLCVCYNPFTLTNPDNLSKLGTTLGALGLG